MLSRSIEAAARPAGECTRRRRRRRRIVIVIDEINGDRREPTRGDALSGPWKTENGMHT